MKGIINNLGNKLLDKQNNNKVTAKKRLKARLYLVRFIIITYPRFWSYLLTICLIVSPRFIKVIPYLTSYPSTEYTEYQCIQFALIILDILIWQEINDILHTCCSTFILVNGLIDFRWQVYGSNHSDLFCNAASILLHAAFLIKSCYTEITLESVIQNRADLF